MKHYHVHEGVNELLSAPSFIYLVLALGIILPYPGSSAYWHAHHDMPPCRTEQRKGKTDPVGAKLPVNRPATPRNHHRPFFPWTAAPAVRHLIYAWMEWGGEVIPSTYLVHVPLLRSTRKLPIMAPPSWPRRDPGPWHFVCEWRYIAEVRGSDYQVSGRVRRAAGPRLASAVIAGQSQARGEQK